MTTAAEGTPPLAGEGPGESSPAPIRPWTPADSAALYRVAGWGDPYFRIDDRGEVVVTPRGEGGPSLSLYRLVGDLQNRGLTLPLLIRFSDILGDRIARLNECFQEAIAEYAYPGVYRGVYPLKVNPQRHLVEEVVAHGRAFSFGLEAGSKPELLVAAALLDTPEALIICNGFKDQEYIETALLATRLGKRPVIVIERFEELGIVLRAVEKLGVEPILGVRAKLHTRGGGRWADSAGDRAKFGLTVTEIVQVAATLRKANLLHTLRLLHFHIGSQISQIQVIKAALREASQIYAELAADGAPMGYLDVGGGLGIDYDGSKTDFPASKNYNMQEYAYDVVAAIKSACERRGVPPPTLVSESGRALMAHQSVLVFDVLGVREIRPGEPEPPHADDPEILREIWDTYQGIEPDNVQEAYHDAAEAKEQALTLFSLGYINLKQRAEVERLYWACCLRILDHLRGMTDIPEELENLDDLLSAVYYGNFSLFQSLPDSWAIDQLFPIMPIHRLGEEPSRRGTLADLTCDSDGKIDQFIDLQDVKPALELHPFTGEPYYIGVFLTGAYQEILGALHNLFGDTDAVHVQVTEAGYRVSQQVRGDTMAQVLRYVQYEDDELLEQVRRETEEAIAEGRMTLEQARVLLRHYERSLRGTTYLTPEQR